MLKLETKMMKTNCWLILTIDIRIKGLNWILVKKKKETIDIYETFGWDKNKQQCYNHGKFRNFSPQLISSKVLPLTHHLKKCCKIYCEI